MVQPHKVTEDDMMVDDRGGLYDDFDAAITAARFDLPRSEYVAAGTSDPQLFLTLESAQFPNPFDQNYSLGDKKGWEIAQGGAAVVSTVDPEDYKFHGSSFGGMLVTRISSLLGSGDVKAGVKNLINRGFYMTEAGMYTGLNFHWKREDLPRVNSAETSKVLMPVAFLGDNGVAAVPATGGEIDNDTLALLNGLATGATDGKPKDDKELKTALLQDADLKHLAPQVFSQGLLETLVKDGKMKKGKDGKYV
ncbi:hypothetical protein KKE60_04580 [Patescibacteria group bacterium]|nr:hypothetical protein [Patescibacteria group bacterium]